MYNKWYNQHFNQEKINENCAMMINNSLDISYK